MGVQIQVHTRQKGKIVQKLEAIEGVATEIVEPEIGDFIIDARTAVIKKSATDFILNVVDKSLADQVGKWKITYERPILLLEGDIFNPRFHQKAFDVHWALSYLTILQAVPVLVSPDVDSSAMLIYCLAAHSQEAVAHNIQRSTPPKIKREAQKHLLQGLPGVDEETAEGLLKHFGSARQVLAAEHEALCDALDTQRAERITKILDHGAGG